MRVRFWGTRGSIPVASAGVLRYGGNTACIEVVASDGTRVLIDAGSGAWAFSRETGGAATSGHLLVSHLHWDHIQGLPFCDPLFAPDTAWQILLPASASGHPDHARLAIERQMGYANHPIAFDEMPGQPALKLLGEGRLDLGGFRVHTRLLHHPTLTLGFRLEADGGVLVYCSDHEPHEAHTADVQLDFAHREDRAHVEFLRGADLLVHDAQYDHAEYARRIGWGHTSVERAVDYAVAADVGCLALFHHDPNREDGSVDALQEKATRQARTAGSDLRVLAASEGLCVEVKGDRPPTEGAGVSALRAGTSAPAVLAVRAGGPAERLLRPGTVDPDDVRLEVCRPAEDLRSFARALRPDVLVLEPRPGLPDPLEEATRLREDLPEGRRPALLLWTPEVPSSARLREAFDAGFDDVAGGIAKRSVLRARVETWALRRPSA